MTALVMNGKVITSAQAAELGLHVIGYCPNCDEPVPPTVQTNPTDISAYCALCYHDALDDDSDGE